MSLLSASFFLLLMERKVCHCKIYSNYWFCPIAVFHVYSIQIYFESKYSKKLRFLDLYTEGLESIGFDIPIYASLAA